MEFIKSTSNKVGVEKLTKEIIKGLLENKKVLWFLTGGSNSQTCVDVFKGLVESKINLDNLTVTLTDERYGDVGHKDSNWHKLQNLGFDFSKVKNIPVLVGQNENETTDLFNKKIQEALENNDVVIGTFGVGADVHIAGILPNIVGDKTPDDFVISYEGADFKRTSMGFKTIKKVDKAFVFIFGDNKKPAVEKIKECKESMSEEPAQILHQIPEVKIFTDQ